MGRNTATDDGRTDTERHADDVSADDLIEGDRIDKRLVAKHADQIGTPFCQTMPDKPDEPETRLVQVTQTRGMDDSHTAILYDPDADLFVRAGRIDRNQAMTQAEADWTVRDIGTDVVVEEIDELERPAEEQDVRAARYVQSWVETLFGELQRNGGDMDFRDELRVNGTTLLLRDYDGRQATVTISLE